MPSLSRAQRLSLSLAVLAGTILLWCRESDLAYNIAQQRPILLGRYTESYAYMLLAVTLLAAWLLYALGSSRSCLPFRQARRQTLFKAAALLCSGLLALLCIDLFLRVSVRHYYEDPEEAGFYRRPPNQHVSGVYHDLPAFPFSYPQPQPGAPPVPYVFTTDAFGFRNSIAAPSYAWMAIGDSFTEGSQVSDADVWVARLGERLGRPIYNCGISGGSPLTYLALLKVQGKNVSADGALCMLYEGNDFRASNFRAEKQGRGSWYGAPGRYLHSSPLRRLLKRQMIRLLGPVGSRRFAGNPAVHTSAHPLYPVSWLPFSVEVGASSRFAFDVKRLEQHLLTREAFEASRGCRETLRLLKEFRDTCRQQDKALAVVYAPDAPHVLIDAICARVPADQLHAYMATRVRHLPAPETLKERLRQGCEVRETVMREFCAAEGIPFLTLTPMLKARTAAGEQTYFCYDQHWTPAGHQAVADFLAEQLPALMGAAAMATPP